MADKEHYRMIYNLAKERDDYALMRYAEERLRCLD